MKNAVYSAKTGPATGALAARGATHFAAYFAPKSFAVHQINAAARLPTLRTDVILVSDAHAAYRRFARESGIVHEHINLRRGVRLRWSCEIGVAIPLQNVNGYHCRFKRWLRHFNGVATRYLDNYLGWQWAIDLQRIDSAELFLRAALRAPGR